MARTVFAAIVFPLLLALCSAAIASAPEVPGSGTTVSIRPPEADSGAEKMRLQLVLSPAANCVPTQPPPDNYLEVRDCSGGYPGSDAEVTAAGARLVATLDEAARRYREQLDWEPGITLRGEGEGATGAVLQSMALPHAWYRALVTRVEATGGYSLPREDTAVMRDIAGDALDFRQAAASGGVKNIYYRLHGATDGEEGRTNPEFFRLCEQYRIACFGTWYGEAEGGTAAARATGDLFANQAQDVAVKKVLPVFTDSSANHWGPRGHYNLGLSWDVDASARNDKGLLLPLRYRRATGLGAGLPDQPQQVTFHLTLRRTGELGKKAGRKLTWMLQGSDQSGTATVAPDGAIDIGEITLASSDQYRNLWVVPAGPQWKLVYTRQPRATTGVPGTPIGEGANWQHVTDVGRINGGLAEADVVIDDLEGEVKVIHDCTTSQQICVAHEARVSPDGSKIVYSVGYGNTLNPVYAEGIRLPIDEIPGLTHAELWIYDLKTGRKAPIPHRPAQAIDRQPEWLNNEKIVFASNRGNTYPFKNQFGFHRGTDQYGRGRCFNHPYCVSQDYGYGRAGMSMQIWTMNIDGTDARNISPHENNALAPAVMSNGDILYSCWNAHGNKSHDSAAATSNRPGTSKNKWWLCRTDGNGADQTVILNGHKTTTLKTREYLPGRMTGGEGRAQLRAIRSVAEIFPGKLAVSNYYRSNHVGSMGIVYGIDYDDPHVEGCSTASCYPDGEMSSGRPGSGRYVPSSLRPVTPYGNDQDMDVRRDERGRALGKAGYAAPLPNTDTEFMITHGRGSCYEVTSLNQANRAAMGGEPTCQKAIYKVKVPMVTDPFDTRQMELLAGGERWQAWDARAIATYRELQGKELPDQPPPLEESAGCYLQVVDARAAELAPAEAPYNWHTNLFSQCAHQGCAVNTEDPDFHRENMAALTILLPEMWDMTYGDGNEETFAGNINNMGHKSIAILGSQPLQPDGSVKMRVPCETPLLMTGTDSEGMAIAHDEMLHSLRRGETRTCHGCHDGHSEERARKLQGSAVERFSKTQAYTTAPAMPEASPPVTFEAVRPILERRCAGCHRDMTDADGLLYSRVAWDFEQHDWNWARKQGGVGQRTHVAHVLIHQGGRGYKKGDQLVFAEGGARGEVARVNRRGGIVAIRLFEGGQGYEPFSPVSVNSAQGKNARLLAMTSYFDLPRPYTSKWVAKFARDSLLYWKCVGSRRDGRTDRQYDNDIDFGPAHDSGATPEECRTIGQWIDTGIQRH